MKKLVILLIVSLMASAAFAVVDEDPNMLGFYLDMNADVTENPAAAGMFPIYVVLTNPTHAVCNGVEFGFDIIGTPGFVASAVWPADAVALGGLTGARGDYAVGFAQLNTTPATIVGTLNYYFTGPCEFVMTANLIPSGLPDLPAILVEGEVTNVGLSAGIGNVSLALGTDTQVVANEDISLDNLKSLFR